MDFTTFQKWQRDLNHECQMKSWLDCDTEKEGAKKVVTKLKCKVCTEFVEKIKGRKNFRNRWIFGAYSLRIHVSSVRDHTKSDQHSHAMALLKKQRSQSAGLGPSTYAPIAQGFSKLSDDERKKLQVKFDISYFVATENLPFTKYPKICELETRYGVNVGTSYVNENAGKDFMHYIAESRRQELKEKLAKAKFSSLLQDVSTDAGNVHNEVFLAVWWNCNGSDQKVHTRMEQVTVVRPQSVTAKVFLKCLKVHCRTLASLKSQPSTVRSLLA